MRQNTHKKGQQGQSPVVCALFFKTAKYCEKGLPDKSLVICFVDSLAMSSGTCLSYSTCFFTPLSCVLDFVESAG